MFSLPFADLPLHKQPFHLELNFFNKENRVLHYPVRAFYIDGLNLVAYNLSSGAESVYKKLYTSVSLGHLFIQKDCVCKSINWCAGLYVCFLLVFQIPANVEYYPKYIVYSKKRHIFLVVYEFSGSANEVVLYWENTAQQSANSKASTIKGYNTELISLIHVCMCILRERTYKLVYIF